MNMKLTGNVHVLKAQSVKVMTIQTDDDDATYHTFQMFVLNTRGGKKKKCINAV